MARGLTSREFLQWLQRAVKRAGSQQALAQELGISAAYLSDILHAHRRPGQKVLTKCGYRSEPHYYLSSEPSD